MKTLLRLAYNGESYCGWQVQKNGISVQGEMCRAAETVFGEGVKVTGCSRTDSGVHAREYYCTLETPDSAPVLPVSRIPTAINRYLPESITAPVKIGDRIGTVTHKRGDRVIGTSDICASEQIERISFGEILIRMMRLFFVKI